MTPQFISGTMAAAEAACLARVDVVAAYPITPQTHIVEALSQFVYDGRLKAELVQVESEHSAMSATVGAAMVGSRAFTASSSQGLALMHEVLPYAAGLRLPLVMAVANRSVASPVTIFTDHQDSLMQRDTGFLQFYCETCQEILDCILLAYRVAEHENVLLPVMICFDGFFLSHINEPVEIPAQGAVDEFLPKVVAKHPILDVDDPKSFNVMAFPDIFEEFQRDKQQSMTRAEAVFDEAAGEYRTLFGREHSRLETYRVEDADYILIGLGSMMGTVRECVDQLRSGGKKVGLAKIKCYRPFPKNEIVLAASGCKAVGVLDRDLAYGSGGIVYQDVCRSLYSSGSHPLLSNFILGLGGRDVTSKTVKACFAEMTELDAGKEIYWPDENAKLLKTWNLDG